MTRRRRWPLIVGMLCLLALGGAAAALALRGPRLVLLTRVDLELTTPGDWVFAVSHDGTRVALEGDGTVGLHDAATLVAEVRAEVDSRSAFEAATRGRGRRGEFGPLDRDLIFLGPIAGFERCLVRWSLTAAEPVRWGPFASIAGELSVAPIGTLTMATDTSGRTLRLLDRDGEERAYTFMGESGSPGPIRETAFAADSESVFTLHDRAVVTYDQRLVARRTTPLASGALHFALVPGEAQALVSTASDVSLVELATGACPVSRALPHVLQLEIAPDRDDMLALAVTEDGRLHLLDTTTLVERALLEGPKERPTRAHFRPRTTELLVSHGAGSLERWSYAHVR